MLYTEECWYSQGVTNIEVYEQIDPLKDVAVGQYTGGTTGKMNGVMLTHHNLTSIPLYHVYGMTTVMNLCIYVGGAILLFAKFDLEDAAAKTTTLDTLNKSFVRQVKVSIFLKRKLLSPADEA